AEQGAGLLEVEGLTLGEIFLRGDVEQHDVAELPAHGEVRQFATDVACADQTNLSAFHLSLESRGCFLVNLAPLWTRCSARDLEVAAVRASGAGTSARRAPIPVSCLFP